MARKKTAEISNSGLLIGDKLYLKRARKVLPYLVRQAKACQKIFYSSLAHEVGISNPRNLNYVLGAIGNALIELGEQASEQIPPIQCLVVNKRDEMPGEGFAGFITSVDISKLNKIQKEIVINAQLAEIFVYPHWDWVLERLGLNPLKTDLGNLIEKAKYYQASGESEQHRKFKEYISNNPSVLNLDNTVKLSKIEYKLISADAIDILFVNRSQLIGVEVKSTISNSADILRGLFQCVKYKSLITAQQMIKNDEVNCRVILALQGAFPIELIPVKNILGLEVIDNLHFHI